MSSLKFPKAAVLALILTLILAACVDKTGLTEKSAKVPAGNPNAAVVVTEYGDFQCPACGAAYPKIVKPLLAKYGTQIRYDFRQFPLQTLHEYALESAMASECAADQGKFWEFVDKDYMNQKDLSSEELRTWADELKVDTALFDRCIKSKIKKDTVLAEYEEGRTLGVQGTPTFFVNGKKVDNTLEAISAEIEAATKGVMQRL